MIPSVYQVDYSQLFSSELCCRALENTGSADDLFDGSDHCSVGDLNDYEECE